MLSRRTFLTTSTLGLPILGQAAEDLEPFTKLMTSFIDEHQVPGAALAVTRHGRLVYARGFGYGDVARKQQVQASSLFRIASVSKPITAIGIMQLIERGKLSLDDNVLDRLPFKPANLTTKKFDERLKKVTVRQCLHHTGGWDREQSFDPIGRTREIAKVLSVPLPVKPNDIVRYMLNQPLDFSPGERYAYSNFGYLILGRLIESVSKQSYETYIQQEVFKPLGIKTAQLGRALVENRAVGEVSYFDAKKRKGACLYPPRLDEQVPLPDGAENFEGFDAHGGWVISASDLVKLVSAFDDPEKCPLMKAKTIESMWARPTGPAGRDTDGKPKPAFMAAGWLVRPVGTKGKVNAWHTGLIAGTEALIVRRWDGLCWAVLFNTAYSGSQPAKTLTGLIDGSLHVAVDQVRRWPTEDLFGK